MEQREVLEICSVCEKINLGDKVNPNWINKDQPVYTPLSKEYAKKDKISHGYCPECFNKKKQNNY